MIIIKPDTILEYLRNKAQSEQQQMAVKNMIALFVTGSHLYGTNTETSDYDFEGVFIEDPEYVIGCKRCDEVSFSTNKENTRNTPDDVDCKFYSLRKFMDLAKLNNPNKVEWFFIPDNCFVYRDDRYWEKLKAAKGAFLSKKLKHSFSGYATSQEHKLVTKKRRLDELTAFRGVLKELLSNPSVKTVRDLDLFETYQVKRYDSDSETIGVHTLKRVKHHYNFISYKIMSDGSDALQVDSKCFNYGMSAKQVYEFVDNEVEKYGGRTKSLMEYGMDLKFASHLFRLHYEGLQLLREGKIDLPFKDPERQFMLDVKRGKYSLDYLLEESNKLKPQFDVEYEKSALPHHPDDEAISKLQMELHLEFWRSNG